MIPYMHDMDFPHYNTYLCVRINQTKATENEYYYNTYPHKRINIITNIFDEC